MHSERKKSEYLLDLKFSTLSLPCFLTSLYSHIDKDTALVSQRVRFLPILPTLPCMSFIIYWPFFTRPSRRCVVLVSVDRLGYVGGVCGSRRTSYLESSAPISIYSVVRWGSTNHVGLGVPDQDV